MKKAILARKLGMTQIFNERGQFIPVTVLEAGPCTVIQKKTLDKDGYQSIQVGFSVRRKKQVTRPVEGHFRKAAVTPKRYISEFRLKDADAYQVGQEIKVDIFAPGEYVDISGISRGKGFAGAIKRFGQGRGPMTHGSHYHRGPGSLGSIDPARVFKGQTLPGRMGGKRRTVQKLQVVKVDPERNILLVKGSVPGARGSVLKVKNSVKK